MPFIIPYENDKVLKYEAFIATTTRGRAARSARWAHNPKVTSSNLVPATISNNNYLQQPKYSLDYLIIQSK